MGEIRVTFWAAFWATFWARLWANLGFILGIVLALEVGLCAGRFRQIARLANNSLELWPFALFAKLARCRTLARTMVARAIRKARSGVRRSHESR